MRRFHSREFGNEKGPGIPGARETGARNGNSTTDRLLPSEDELGNIFTSSEDDSIAGTVLVPSA